MKKLILKIAQLPKKHQLWIIKQLPEELRQKFMGHRGSVLLKEAQVFSKIRGPLPQQKNLPKSLPKISQFLSNKSDLFIAIILHEGQFDWADIFLNQHERRESIKKLINNKVQDIKAESRQLLFQNWMNTKDFNEFVEVYHG